MAQSAAISPSLYRNAFPNKNNLSTDISPRTIVTGRGKLNAKNELKVAWGRYCEVYANGAKTNDAGTRTIAAISLHPSNHNGGYYFMNLDMGGLIRGNQWTELPMTNKIIDDNNMYLIVSQNGIGKSSSGIKELDNKNMNQ